MRNTIEIEMHENHVMLSDDGLLPPLTARFGILSTSIPFLPIIQQVFICHGQSTI